MTHPHSHTQSVCECESVSSHQSRHSWVEAWLIWRNFLSELDWMRFPHLLGTQISRLEIEARILIYYYYIIKTKFLLQSNSKSPVWKIDLKLSHILRIRLILSLRQAAQRRERCRRDVYTSGIAVCAAVCAAQMGANFRQYSGTVPLWADAACTIFPSGTGAVTNQSSDFISDRFSLPVFRSWVKSVGRQIRIWIVIGCCLPDTEEIAHVGSVFCRWITRSYAHLTAILSGF